MRTDGHFGQAVISIYRNQSTIVPSQSISLIENVALQYGVSNTHMACYATLRDRNVLVFALSDVAASLLDGGRNVHSKFKIPIACFADSNCNISSDYALPKLQAVK